MAKLLCYTKKGEDNYRDLNDSMHLALGCGGKVYTPLRNNTGILFPRADLDEGTMAGTTKTLRQPWLFRYKDGSGGVLAVRFNNGGHPDPQSTGSVMVYRTNNFVFYEFMGFLKLDDTEIKNPRCTMDKDGCRIEWEAAGGSFRAWTEDFKSVKNKETAPLSLKNADDVEIPGAVPGNVLEINDAEESYIRKMLGTVYNIGVSVSDFSLRAGSAFTKEQLPKALCLYSDGSTAAMRVDWDREALANIDTSKKGEYAVPGKIVQKTYPVPFIENASDPCVFKYNGRYYFTSSAKKVQFRSSLTLDGLRTAEPVVIRDQPNASFWAQELHFIKGTPYFFTSLCRDNKWYTIQSVIIRCNGDINNPEDWEEPHWVIKKDGGMLNKDKGICLDMTYFCVNGVHYVSWSNRDMDPKGFVTNEYGVNGPADIYIAVVDPDKPWQLTSDPVCLCRPMYGWDRVETEVDEGPYLLRHGEDLFITFSGASVGIVYAVGILRAKCGADLLDPSSWEELPYPILTSESYPGQYGPGHNNFFKDPDDPDIDMISLLYRPLNTWAVHDPDENRKNPRHAAIRRVHWNASGLPNLEMTKEQELDRKFADVSLRIQII
jgi:GH43 family beta-xylosidase